MSGSRSLRGSMMIAALSVPQRRSLQNVVAAPQERGRVAIADFDLAEQARRTARRERAARPDRRVEIGDERPRERSRTSGSLLAELLHPTTPIEQLVVAVARPGIVGEARRSFAECLFYQLEKARAPCPIRAAVTSILAALQLNDALFTTMVATFRAWNHSSSSV